MATLNYPPPPVPPRPSSSLSSNTAAYPSPPRPPLPPEYRNEQPLAAPRPHRLDPDLPANMARSLDEQLAYNGPRLSTPQPPPGSGPGMGINHTPGFVFAGAPAPFYSSPPPAGAAAPMIPMPHMGDLSNSMGGLSINAPRQRTVSSLSPGLPVPQNGGDEPRQRAISTSGPPPNYGAPYFQSPPQPPPVNNSLRTPGAPPGLTAPLPTIPSLQSALPAVQTPGADVGSKVSWIRDVLLLVSKSTSSTRNKQQATSIDPSLGPVHITDPALQRLVDAALPMLVSLAPGVPAQGQRLTAPLAEALHMRATLSASGSFPSHIPQNQRTAFREFEATARSGYLPASWFRIGRDYESFGDGTHAISCYDKGVRAEDESCLYRLGMASLLGQLGILQDVGTALPMLQRAATLASISVPQPAYVYALILLGDTSSLPLNSPIPQQLIAPLIPSGSNALAEGRKHLERAAYLHFTPAQYKLGHAYEFAEPPFPFDALLSVQYYSLASQTGEAEADLALSRWFLCGSNGSGGTDPTNGDSEAGFAKDENLAYIFGEKAAKRGLPSAEFALGYYWEVGVGVPAPDVQRAIGWYELAAKHGNNDAVQRLTELKRESAHALTRQEHEVITENKLVRKRTQAKIRSDATGAQKPTVVGGINGSQVIEGVRKNNQMPARQSLPPRHSSFQAQTDAYSGSAPSGHQSPPPPTVPSAPIANMIPQDPTQQLRDRPRYSLIDPGSGTSSPPRSSGSPRPIGGRGGRPGGRVVTGGYSQSSPKLGSASLPPTNSAPSSPPVSEVHKTKYTTFADMGVQGHKAEDKDCVIM